MTIYETKPYGCFEENEPENPIPLISTTQRPIIPIHLQNGGVNKST